MNKSDLGDTGRATPAAQPQEEAKEHESLAGFHGPYNPREEILHRRCQRAESDVARLQARERAAQERLDELAKLYERAIESRERNGLRARKAETELAAVRAPSGEGHWQPIETALKETMAPVLLGWFNPPASAMYDVGFWHPRERAWCDTHHVLHNQQSHPTHWQPLPKAPNEEVPLPAPPGSGDGRFAEGPPIPQVDLPADAAKVLRDHAWDLIGDGPPRPTIICLCGSTRFVDTWTEQYQRLSDEGNIVLTVARMPPRPNLQHDEPELKARLDGLHLRKIDLADEVFVLNVYGYLGASTRNEIAYAEAHGKPVRYLETLAAGAGAVPPPEEP